MTEASPLSPKFLSTEVDLDQNAYISPEELHAAREKNAQRLAAADKSQRSHFRRLECGLKALETSFAARPETRYYLSNFAQRILAQSASGIIAVAGAGEEGYQSQDDLLYYQSYEGHVETMGAFGTIEDRARDELLSLGVVTLSEGADWNQVQILLDKIRHAEADLEQGDASLAQELLRVSGLPAKDQTALHGVVLNRVKLILRFTPDASAALHHLNRAEIAFEEDKKVHQRQNSNNPAHRPYYHNSQVFFNLQEALKHARADRGRAPNLLDLHPVANLPERVEEIRGAYLTIIESDLDSFDPARRDRGVKALAAFLKQAQSGRDFHSISIERVKPLVAKALDVAPVHLAYSAQPEKHALSVFVLLGAARYLNIPVEDDQIQHSVQAAVEALKRQSKQSDHDMDRGRMIESFAKLEILMTNS